MPGLMQMLQKLKKNDDDCKILVLGLDNAGKTTILRQLGKEDLSQVRPTQGFNMQLLQHGPYTLNCARPASARPSRAPQKNDARAPQAGTSAGRSGRASARTRASRTTSTGCAASSTPRAARSSRSRKTTTSAS